MQVANTYISPYPHTDQNQPAFRQNQHQNPFATPHSLSHNNTGSSNKPGCTGNNCVDQNKSTANNGILLPSSSIKAVVPNQLPVEDRDGSLFPLPSIVLEPEDYSILEEKQKMMTILQLLAQLKNEMCNYLYSGTANGHSHRPNIHQMNSSQYLAIQYQQHILHGMEQTNRLVGIKHQIEDIPLFSIGKSKTTLHT